MRGEGGQFGPFDLDTIAAMKKNNGKGQRAKR